MIVYRIADSRHPIFDATGALLHGGRWNSVGLRAIYAAETYAGALLEVLVHSNLSQPPKHHRVVRIEVPDKVKVEKVSINTVPSGTTETCKPPATSEIAGLGKAGPRYFAFLVSSLRGVKTTSFSIRHIKILL